MMKNILKKLTLPIMAIGMMVGATGNAFALELLDGVIDDQGRHWGNPFTDDLLNKSQTDQETLIAAPYMEATIEEFYDAADYFGNNDSLTDEGEAIAFAAMLGFDSTKFLITRFLAPPEGSVARVGDFGDRILFCDATTTYSCGLGVGDGPAGFIGYSFYQEVSAPSLVGLLGSSFMYIGYMAYRRRKA